MASGVAVLLIIFVALMVGGAAGAGVAAYSVVDGLNLKTMKADYPGVNSKIYADNGQLLYKIPSPENRTPVTSPEISPWLKKATVDIEDKRFYQHGGVDLEGIFRAAVDDVNAGHVVQGASTIEQQVVRNLYLDNDPTATRKLKEAWWRCRWPTTGRRTRSSRPISTSCPTAASPTAARPRPRCISRCTAPILASPSRR